MEKRLYFIFGDVLSDAAIGGLAGLGAAGLVSAGWHMLIGMGIGMIVGTGVSFLALLIFCPFFGADGSDATDDVVWHAVRHGAWYGGGDADAVSESGGRDRCDDRHWGHAGGYYVQCETSR